MEGKQAKDFTNTRTTNSLWVILSALLICVVLCTCQPDAVDDPIPLAVFPTITLNLNLPENITLKTKGNSRAIGGGVRGIIIYCLDPGVYHAYERNCSFMPNEACATVNIDASTLFMTDPCCGSNFDFNTGNPMGGAAWRPLRQYRATYDGTVLTITDEVLE